MLCWETHALADQTHVHTNTYTHRKAATEQINTTNTDGLLRDEIMSD